MSIIHFTCGAKFAMDYETACGEGAHPFKFVETTELIKKVTCPECKDFISKFEITEKIIKKIKQN